MTLLLQPFSPQAQFHLLRHFCRPPEDYLGELSAALSLPLQDLVNEVQLPASKFSSAFAATPDELYRRLLAADSSQVQVQPADPLNEKVYHIISFDEQQWPGGIGDDSVVPVSTLDKNKKGSIQLQSRDSFMIQTLKVDRLPTAFQLVLITSLSGDVITAFPGRMVPPLSENMIRDWVFLTADRKQHS